jgi:uncharacterized phiE125 gp8 family phage protein
VKVDGDIIPAYSKWWPVDTLVPGDAVKVSFTAGYGTDIPRTTKQAMLMLIGNWYENREAVVLGTKTPSNIPFGVDALLSMDRMW